MVEVVPPDSWRGPGASVAAETPTVAGAPAGSPAETAPASVAGDPIAGGSESNHVLPAVPRTPPPSGTERFGHRLAIAVAASGLAAGSLALLALYVVDRPAPASGPVAATPAAAPQPVRASPERPVSAAAGAVPDPHAVPDPGVVDRSQRPPSERRTAAPGAPVPPTRGLSRRAPQSDATPGRRGPIRRETSQLDAGLKTGPAALAADQASGRPHQVATRSRPKKDALARTSPLAVEVARAAAVTSAPTVRSSDVNEQPQRTDRQPGSKGRPTRRADDSKPVIVPQPTAEPVDVQARLSDPIV